MSECNPHYFQTSFYIYGPVTTPQEQCAWCWPYIHPDISYPEHWSSTICAQHFSQVIEQRHRRNRKKRYITLLEIYTYLLYCSPSPPQLDNDQWRQMVQQLFSPEQDLEAQLQIICTTARHQGQNDYLRYIEKIGQNEPFSLIWERGHIAAGRFFRHPNTTICDKVAHHDAFTYWYSIGYMQQAFFLHLKKGKRKEVGQISTTYQILIEPAGDGRAALSQGSAIASADGLYPEMVLPARNPSHLLGGALS
ncbi:hypothetical protein KDH_23570 [Dictyobacter sp. S3.2.2.5]|uniref:Uncharacterized protein n=1 Tax=Dictyobacter halimunensis TaxID=3026934 RepID=A0ABQ6FMN7_9CHLR|nr:hypothetical protein KDH_23570 [Dictyobacter sp. S3.2.2.5]